MIAVGIVIFSLMIVSSVIWRHYHRKRKAREFLVSLEKSDGVAQSSLAVYGINICCATLGQIIDAIMSGDKIQICKRHRLFAAEYDKFEQFYRQSTDPEVRDNIYLKHLWEATLKIAESGRKMVVHPEFNCKASEIRDLAFWKNNLPDSQTIGLPDGAEKCRLNKGIIAEIIKNYSYTMSYNDFDEGALKYSYLSFLYYLRSFMTLLDNLMKPYRVA